MERTIVTCDGCKTEIPPGAPRLNVLIRSRTSVDDAAPVLRHDLDVCNQHCLLRCLKHVPPMLPPKA